MSDGKQYDIIEDLLAKGGVSIDGSSVDLRGSDPVLPTRFRIGDAATASIAAIGIMANKLWMLRGGSSQRMSVDIHHVAAALRGEHNYTLNGVPPADVWHEASGFFQTKDDQWVQLHCNIPHLRAGMMNLLGVKEERSAVARALRTMSATDFEQAVISANLCAAMVRSEEEWRSHPHATAVAGLPLLEVVKAGDSDPEMPAAARRPLDGVRVLDLTHVIAGPVCGRTLAEHGADVMRISAPHRYNHQDFVVETGHGKLSVNLDLREATERDKLFKLVRSADIFVQGFRPGALAGFGLTVDDLVAQRPGVIYVTLSAFGHAGPWSARRGFDSLLQTTTGIAAEGGEGGVPRHLPAQALDYVTGYLAAYGALVALEQRARVGGSYLVRVSLAQTGRWIQSLGRVDTEGAVMPPMPGPEAVAPWMVERATNFGTVRYVKPVLRMSETDPRWVRSTAPFGTDEAAWP